VGSRCQREQRKEKERERRAGAGRAKWAGRPGWAERREGKVFFFFFSFSNFFLKPLFFSNSNQNSFKPFLKNL
jgi:hypothetical protein